MRVAKCIRQEFLASVTIRQFRVPASKRSGRMETRRMATISKRAWNRPNRLLSLRVLLRKVAACGTCWRHAGAAPQKKIAAAARSRWRESVGLVNRWKEASGQGAAEVGKD